MGFLAAVLSAGLSSAKDLLSKRLAFRLDGTVSTFASFFFALPYYVVVLAVAHSLIFSDEAVVASHPIGMQEIGSPCLLLSPEFEFLPVLSVLTEIATARPAR